MWRFDMRINKRTFIKLSAAPLLRGLCAWGSSQALTNWAGDFVYSTNRLYEAHSVEQVRSILKAQRNLRVLGTRHCFNRIADSSDSLLVFKPAGEVISLDPMSRTVSGRLGITYGRLCPYLDGRGFALHNLASLPHISVAGSCSTPTHGSGEKNGNLATAISALEIVTGEAIL
jgi:xylitol oxidase